MKKRRVAVLNPILTKHLTQTTYVPSQNTPVSAPWKPGELVWSRNFCVYKDEWGLENETHPNWWGKAYGEWFQRGLAEDFVRWSKIKDWRTSYVFQHALGLLFGVHPWRLNAVSPGPMIRAKPLILDPELERLFPGRAQAVIVSDGERYKSDLRYPIEEDPFTERVVSNGEKIIYLAKYFEVVRAPYGPRKGKAYSELNVRNRTIRKACLNSDLEKFDETLSYQNEASVVLEVSEGGSEVPFLFIDFTRRKLPPAWTSPVTLRMNMVLHQVKLKFTPSDGDLLFGRNIKHFGVYLPSGWKCLMGYRLEHGLYQDVVFTRKGIPWGHLNGHILSHTGKKQRVMRLKRLVRRAFDPRITYVVRLTASDLVHADFKSEMFLHHLKLRFKNNVSFLRFRIPLPHGGVQWCFFLQRKDGHPFTPSDLDYLKRYLERSWEYRTMKKKYGLVPFWATRRDKFYPAKTLKHMLWMIEYFRKVPLIVTAVVNTIARLNKNILCVDDYTTSRDLDEYLTKKRRRYVSKIQKIKKGIELRVFPKNRKEAERLYQVMQGKFRPFEYEPTWFHRKFPYVGFGKALQVANGSEPPDLMKNGVVRRFRVPLVLTSSTEWEEVKQIVFAYDTEKDLVKVLWKRGDMEPVPLQSTARLLVKVRRKYARRRSIPFGAFLPLEIVQYYYKLRKRNRRERYRKIAYIVRAFECERADGSIVDLRNSVCFLPVLTSRKPVKSIRPYVIPTLDYPLYLFVLSHK